MLELRPNCELCDRDLPPESPAARICSYECTFCADCAERALRHVCPNCGGNLVPRPIRPAKSWRPGTGLGHHPPGLKRRRTRHDAANRADFCARLSKIPPELR